MYNKNEREDDTIKLIDFLARKESHMQIVLIFHLKSLFFGDPDPLPPCKPPLNTIKKEVAIASRNFIFLFYKKKKIYPRIIYFFFSFFNDFEFAYEPNKRKL